MARMTLDKLFEVLRHYDPDGKYKLNAYGVPTVVSLWTNSREDDMRLTDYVPVGFADSVIRAFFTGKASQY